MLWWAVLRFDESITNGAVVITPMSSNDTNRDPNDFDPFSDDEPEENGGSKLKDNPLLFGCLILAGVAAIGIFLTAVAASNSVPNSMMENTALALNKISRVVLLIAFLGLLLAFRLPQLKRLFSLASLDGSSNPTPDVSSHALLGAMNPDRIDAEPSQSVDATPSLPPEGPHSQAFPQSSQHPPGQYASGQHPPGFRPQQAGEHAKRTAPATEHTGIILGTLAAISIGIIAVSWVLALLIPGEWLRWTHIAIQSAQMFFASLMAVMVVFNRGPLRAFAIGSLAVILLTQLSGMGSAAAMAAIYGGYGGYSGFNNFGSGAYISEAISVTTILLAGLLAAAYVSILQYLQGPANQR